MKRLWPAGWQPTSHAEQVPAKSSLILTLAMPPALQQAADKARHAASPAASVHAPAHITLFRQLSPHALDWICRDIRTVSRTQNPVTFDFCSLLFKNGAWMSMMHSAIAHDLRADLADRWFGLLAPGDKAEPRLHVSLGRDQNQRPALLPRGPWVSPALLLWQFSPEKWSPLVAFPFHR